MGTERGAPIGSRSSLRERWAALTTRYGCPPNYEAESSEAPTSASGGSVRKSRVSVRQREIGCRSVDRSKTPRCREDTTHRRTMPTAMAGSERSGLIFGPRGTVNDARRRGGTRPMPSQSRHCSCTCAQLSTRRPPLLLYVPVDQKGGFAMNDVKRSQRRPVGQGGFTLIELLIGVAITSIVAALAGPLYSPSAMRGATCA